MKAFLGLLGGALLLAFWIYTFLDCLRTDSSQSRGLPKGVWILVIIVLPIIGGILWLTIGRSGAGGPGGRANATVNRPVYPDDDLAFLRSVDTEKAREQRIRELEEKLASLDDEKNDNNPNPNSKD